MPFLVKYIQDIPQNCSECPCSIHITPTEVYCNDLQKHFTVTESRPAGCDMIEYEGTKVEVKDIKVLNKIKEELNVNKNKCSECGLIGTASGISRSMDVIDKYLAEVEEHMSKIKEIDKAQGGINDNS